MEHRDISEVCFGLAMEGRLPASMFKSDWFVTPYDKGIDILMQKGATREDVAKVLSSEYINDAHDAVKHWNGIGETENFDWVKSLKECYVSVELGKRLRKLGHRMEQNEKVDILPLYGELSSIISNESSGLIQASDIDYKTYKPFKPCGYAPIDNTLGGIPTDGPIIIYGLTGVGKSTFTTNIINCLLHKYPNETAAIYTLEMNAKHWLWRALNMYPSLQEVLDRLHVSGSVRDIEELVAEIMAKKVDYVVLDDMDNMVKDSSPAEYERIYRRIKEVCRFMAIPFFVLGQPPRAAKFAATDSKDSRFLGPYDVAWSGAAENSAALQIALQITNGLDMKSEMFPTTDDNMDYIIFWKSRDGWPGDYDPKLQRGPGAVVLERGKTPWMGKPYGNKWRLHPPVSGGNSIGKRKKKSED